MCGICDDVLWVCESHPVCPWDDSIVGGCECGPGMPCICNPTGAMTMSSELIIGTDKSLNGDMATN